MACLKNATEKCFVLLIEKENVFLAGLRVKCDCVSLALKRGGGGGGGGGKKPVSRFTRLILFLEKNGFQMRKSSI